MPTDATGTPTALGIPTYNVDDDAPSGLGFNEAMAEIDALIQLRAPLADPTFTGTVIAPTPATGDNSTKVATTAFVATQLGVVGTVNSSFPASTSNTTFAGGVDLLGGDLSFTAVAGAQYEVVVTAFSANNGQSGQTGPLHLKLDGADAGVMGSVGGTTALPFYARTVISPAAGAHTVNARLVSSSGTNVTQIASGGPGTVAPIVVSVRRIA